MLPENNFSIDDIAKELQIARNSVHTNVVFNSAFINKYGLHPDYCPGDNPDLRLHALLLYPDINKLAKYNHQGIFFSRGAEVIYYNIATNSYTTCGLYDSASQDLCAVHDVMYLLYSNYVKRYNFLLYSPNTTFTNGKVCTFPNQPNNSVAMCTKNNSEIIIGGSNKLCFYQNSYPSLNYTYIRFITLNSNVAGGIVYVKDYDYLLLSVVNNNYFSNLRLINYNTGATINEISTNHYIYGIFEFANNYYYASNSGLIYKVNIPNLSLSYISNMNISNSGATNTIK